MNELSDIVKTTKKLTLLYVEDNKSVRESTLSILNDIFKETISASDAQIALTKFYENDIDIILSDINMPGMSGLDMAESIRNFDKDIPIILLSAHNEIEYFTRGIDLNVDAYLLKPLQINNLFKVLQKVIKKIKFLEDFNNNLVFLNQYQALADSTSAISKTNLEGIITYVNDNFCRLSGYTKEELLGNRHSIVRHPDSSTSIYTDVWHTIKYKKQAWKGILRNISKSEKTYYIDVVIQPILDKDNNIVEYISIKRDITQIMNPKKQLYDFVESAINPILVSIKIEDFEDLENFYGHDIFETFNQFAKDLEKLMPEHLNFNKFLSLGNGEYVFLQDIKEVSETVIDSLIEELQGYQFIVNELKIDVGEIDYDISILISVASGVDCIENVKYGLKSLQQTNQEFIFANDLAKKVKEESENNLKMLKVVKKAIDTLQVVSYFQPIVLNENETIVKYESLVRIIDEDKKVLTPFFFLDIAKKGKYYTNITHMVLDNSFEALTQTDKSISINLSIIDIEKTLTRDKIYALLQTHKDSAHRVVFELLEDENVKDFKNISDFITKVKEYGVKIAIDDFGAGYSNFERLWKYQPDILKIDGSLVRDINNPYSLSVIKTIISFAKEQDIELVAEYIEDEKIFHILKDLGVEYSQGYYFGKPEAEMI